MDEGHYTIEWTDSGGGISASTTSNNGHQIICESRSDDLIEENNDIEEEEEYLVGEEIIPSEEIITISNSLDQIAAENLIYMAQDGSVAVMGDLIEEQVEQVDNADYNEQQYFECQVTEEVITDDWVQQQGEDRVEVPVDQLVGDVQNEEVMVPLPTDEYTTSRPYPCDFCSRRFRKKANLMNHMVAHKNDRPHICNLCGARYIRKLDLLSHLKVHAQMPDSDLEYVELFMRDEQSKVMERPTIVSSVSQTASTSNSRRKNARQRTTSGKKPASSAGAAQFHSNLQSTLSAGEMSPKLTTGRKIGRSVVKKDTKKASVSAQQKSNAAKLDDIDALLGAAQQHEDYYERHTQSSGQQKQRYPVTDSIRPFVCQVCGVSFAREKALNSHFLIHGVDNALECDSCSDMFWTLEQLQEHQATQHAEDVTSGSEYEPEEKTASDEESDSKFGDYYCNVCGMSFHRLDLLKRHVRGHNQNDSASGDFITSENHCCNVCGSTFAEALDLLAHAEIHTRAVVFKCMLCGESFTQEQNIRSHISTVHAKELTENTCRLCGKHCKDERTLLKHAWDHSKEKNHSCLKCGKTFYNKARLKRHMQSHRNKSVACTICGENFPDGRSLMNHRHSHTNVSGRQFPCRECGKTFGSRSSQQIHMRIHTGERPYGCRFCWKAFADGGTLRKHERIHTGEKPYACPVCPRAFNQRVVLREHIRSHHSGADPTYENTMTPYYCTVCSSTFATPSDIIQHLIEHSDANTISKRQPTLGPRKYKRRRKLKPEELERLRVEEPTSKRETRKRQHSERDDLYSNDTFDDTDSYVMHENYGFTSTSTSLRSKRDRNAVAASASSSRVKTEVISQQDSLDAVLDSMDGTLNDIASPRTVSQTRAVPSTATTVSNNNFGQFRNTSNSFEQKTTAKASTARMIHTKKKVVPAKDGRSKGKTMVTQTTPSPIEKSKKTKSISPKKQTKRRTTAANRALTNGASKLDKTDAYDIEHESSLLLELSKKSAHYSPSVVSDLEEILRSPIKSRDERSSLSQSDPLGDITLSPNYFDQPPAETHQRNTRSSKRLSNRNLTKELNQAVAQAMPSTSTGEKSTRQRSTAKATSSSLFGKDSGVMNIAMHIKQEKEVSYTLSEEPPVVYTCEMCAAEFSDRAQLLVHVPIHI